MVLEVVSGLWQWIRSFLVDRQQRVVIAGLESDYAYIPNTYQPRPVSSLKTLIKFACRQCQKLTGRKPRSWHPLHGAVPVECLRLWVSAIATSVVAGRTLSKRNWWQNPSPDSKFWNSCWVANWRCNTVGSVSDRDIDDLGLFNELGVCATLFLTLFAYHLTLYIISMTSNWDIEQRQRNTHWLLTEMITAVNNQHLTWCVYLKFCI